MGKAAGYSTRDGSTEDDHPLVAFEKDGERIPSGYTEAQKGTAALLSAAERM